MNHLKPLRPCLECGALSDQGLCPKHRRAPASWAERRQSTDLRQAWVAMHGLICPGWNRPAHPVASVGDLTLDHLTPVALGGRDGAVGVLCRSCNASRGIQPLEVNNARTRTQA